MMKYLIIKNMSIVLAAGLQALLVWSHVAPFWQAVGTVGLLWLLWEIAIWVKGVDIGSGGRPA